MRPPKRFLPSIASLRALEALDRLGSATAVAEELHQTQSAVSRQLRSLEDSLGQTLFMREAKRLQLTPEARSYAAEIRQALGQIAQASMRLSFNPHGGTINLAILPTFGMRWLVPRLSDFARLHPEVSINLTTHIGSINFASEPFDAAIVFGSDIPPSTDSLTLKPERVIAVCAPSVMSESGVRPDISALPLLHIASRPDAWRAWFDIRGLSYGQSTGTVYDQFSTILQAALHGLGCALLPDYLAEAELAAGRLVPVLGGPVASDGAYRLIYPQHKAADPALLCFREWLSAQAETEEDPLPR